MDTLADAQLIYVAGQVLHPTPTYHLSSSFVEMGL